MSCALALGTFDGVHIGHKKVLCGAAKAGTAFAVAFSVPPKCYFGSENIIITDSKTKEYSHPIWALEEYRQYWMMERPP